MLVGNRKLMDESGVDVFALEERATALARRARRLCSSRSTGNPLGLWQ